MNEPDRKDPLERRLESLGRALPGRSPDFTRSVLHKLAGEPAGNVDPPDTRAPHLKRWIMRGTLGLAASVLIGAFAWTLLVNEPQPAYGMRDVRTRLAGARSIRVAGHSEDGSRFEIFVERPDRSYRVQRGVRTVMTSARQMVVDDKAKTATIGPSNPFDARVLVEYALQNLVLDTILGPARDRLTKTRSERVGDVDADVYHATLDNGPPAVQTEVYLNPRTGLPIKSVLLVTHQGKASPIVTIDQIEPNATAPADAFDFIPPANYAVKQVASDTHDADAEMMGSGSAGTIRFGVRHAFEVADGRAAVVCWSLYDTKHPADDLKLPSPNTFTVTGPKSDFTERLLHADPTPNGHHWRWSLLIPSDPATRVADNFPTLRLTVKSNVLSNTAPPVRFDRDELAQLILEGQRRTLPPGQQPITLDAIESHLPPIK
jgi:outer membrane lipoprotein-sorting protein